MGSIHNPIKLVFAIQGFLTQTLHVLHIFMAEKNAKALCVQIVVELAFHGSGFYPTLQDEDEDEILSPPSWDFPLDTNK